MEWRSTPSNAFSFGKLKRNRKRGTAKLTVKVPDTGELELAKTKKAKGKQKLAAAAGKVRLPLKPRGTAKKQLRERGDVKLKAKVTYTSDLGSTAKTKRVKLIKR